MARTRTVGTMWGRCPSCGVESTMPVHEVRRGLLRATAATRHAVCVVCSAVSGRPVATPLPLHALPPVRVPGQRPAPQVAR